MYTRQEGFWGTAFMLYECADWQDVAPTNWCIGKIPLEENLFSNIKIKHKNISSDVKYSAVDLMFDLIYGPRF